MLIRCYDLQTVGVDPIFSLFEKVYGDTSPIRDRWEWEWKLHPEAERIVFVVAEEKGSLRGMTVRMPVTLWVGQKQMTGWFATNSMVDPAFRGKGLITALYAKANSLDGVHLSKGTAEGMFKCLLKMNYRWLQPDTNQTCLLSPLQWALQKVGGDKKIGQNEVATILPQTMGYREIKKFAGVIDSPERLNIIAPLKTIDWLNWRYVDIPHRTYKIAMREDAGEIVSWCVVRVQGRIAYLVDLDWRSEQKDEPGCLIRYAKKAARALGAIKLVTWSSAPSLRRKLAKHWFIPRNETPYFSCSQNGRQLLAGKELLFVLGDNDSDYL